MKTIALTAAITEWTRILDSAEHGVKNADTDSRMIDALNRLAKARRTLARLHRLDADEAE